MDLAEYERLNPCCELTWEGVKVAYATPNQATRWRVETLFTKEPVTIDWMTRLTAQDVLVDVGANVGMYSIWAAKVAGARVFSFEPESQNYALLNKNIALNALAGRVTAFCAALSDVAGFSSLYLSQWGTGASCHAAGEPLDFRLEPLRPAFVQGCVTATLDELLAADVLPPPTHIKVDVDGFEHKVFAGAARALRDERLRSLLVEVNQNLEPHRGLVRELEGLGFRWDRAQVEAAERREGPFKGVAEYVFRR